MRQSTTLSTKLPMVEIKAHLCKGCALCIDNCRPNVIYLSKTFNQLGYQFAQAKDTGCTGCEACYYACPEPGAITITKERKVKAVTS